MGEGGGGCCTVSREIALKYRSEFHKTSRNTKNSQQSLFRSQDKMANIFIISPFSTSAWKEVM